MKSVPCGVVALVNKEKLCWLACLLPFPFKKSFNYVSEEK